MKIRRVTWNAEIATRLSNAMRYPDDAQYISAECYRGISECWEVGDGQAYFVTRKEPNDLVIVLFEGSNVLEVAQRCYIAAKRAGLPYVRFHCTSLALIRLVKQQFNPEPVEYVLRVSTNGQQQPKRDDSKHNDNNDEHARYRHHDNRP